MMFLGVLGNRMLFDLKSEAYSSKKVDSVLYLCCWRNLQEY